MEQKAKLPGNFKPEFITPDLITSYTGGAWSRTGLYKRLAAGDLQRFKIGKRTVVKTADIDRRLHEEARFVQTGDRHGHKTKAA